MTHERPRSAARARWRRRTSAALLLVMSLSVAAACATPRVGGSGCICQPDGVLEEIASGELAECAPATEAWEREWHRECAEACGEPAPL